MSYPRVSSIKTVQASFDGYFLGGVDRLISLMETSWIQSHALFSQFPSLETLLDRAAVNKTVFKIKYDFVKEPIPRTAFQGMWSKFYEDELGKYASITLVPYGWYSTEWNSIPTSSWQHIQNLIQYWASRIGKFGIWEVLNSKLDN